MLQRHYTGERKRQPANMNIKQFVHGINHDINEMSFKDFIRYVVKDGIDDFYKLTAVEQYHAITKYFLEMDAIDKLDILADTDDEKCLGAQLDKFLTAKISHRRLIEWIRARIFERCLPHVKEAIEQAYRWYMVPYSEAKGINTEEL